MQFGVCASPVDAPWIREAGADFIEAHVQQFLKPAQASWRPAVARTDLPLPIAGYNCFFPGDLKLTGPNVNVEAIRDYARRACRRAAEMGSDFIVFGSGGARTIPDGWPRATAEEQFVEAVRLVGPLAADSGVTVLLEHLNCGESNILNSLPEGLDYLHRAGAPGIAMLCDLFHFALEEEPLENLQGCRGLLQHVHIAEPEGRVPPGPGGMDYRPFFAKLKSLGYDNRISVECNWKDMRAELGPALEFLRREWAAA